LLHTRAVTPLSYLDEFDHLDSLHRATHLQIVRRGEYVSQQTVREGACRGLVETQMPPCGLQTYRPQDLAFGPYNSADVHPPTYYFVTAAVAVALERTHAARDFVDAGRLAGVGWLAVGLVLVNLLARRMGASRLAALGVSLTIGSSLGVVQAVTHISPDNSSLAAGAGVSLLTLAVDRRTTAPTVAGLLCMGIIATLLRVNNVLVVGASALYLLFRAATTGERRASRVTVAVAAVASCTAVIVAWLAIHRAMAIAPDDVYPSYRYFHSLHLHPQDIFKEIEFPFAPTAAQYLEAPFKHEAPRFLAWADSVLLSAGMVGAALYPRLRDPRRALGVAALASLLTAGPLLVLGTYVTAHVFIDAAPRYTLSLLPAVGATLASLARDRLSSLALLAFGVGSVGVVGFYLLRAVGL
jgi:hypothetical protein